MNRLIPAALFAALVPACASSGPAPRAASQPASENLRAQALEGDALTARISDKTHVGEIMGGPYHLYFAPDGEARGEVHGKPFLGRWTREGEDTFCIQWEVPDNIPKGCSFMVGDRVYKVDDGSLRNTIAALHDGERRP